MAYIQEVEISKFSGTTYNALLCNGSTLDFGSSSLGSNPSGVTIRKVLKEQLAVLKTVKV